mmetsp:Transcript_334/g.490  ORF Transcript_334/g.490 Transcript_334/m.490 type:complete len:116 (+) Transcript_334:3-350(+)
MQQQQQQMQQQQQQGSYFSRDAEFDKVEVSSLQNDPEFKRRLNDCQTYFDLFDNPQAEWSSSEFIRKEHHRRKKERKRLGHYQRMGEAREVSGSESLQIGGPAKKRLVRYTGPSN